MVNASTKDCYENLWKEVEGKLRPHPYKLDYLQGYYTLSGVPPTFTVRQVTGAKANYDASKTDQGMGCQQEGRHKGEFKEPPNGGDNCNIHLNPGFKTQQCLVSHIILILRVGGFQGNQLDSTPIFPSQYSN